jgi:predicted deacylase
MAFGLPYVLTVSKPVQPSKGQSSYAAAAEKGIPAVLAEAGGVGQMQEDAVALLVRGVINVMRHLEMIESVADATATANDEARMTNDETNSEIKTKGQQAAQGYDTSHEV